MKNPLIDKVVKDFIRVATIDSDISQMTGDALLEQMAALSKDERDKLVSFFKGVAFRFMTGRF